MGTIQLTDVRLAEFTLTNLPLLKELLAGNLAEKPQVCIERARYVTASLKRTRNSGAPMQLRYAQAVKDFLSRKSPRFFDGNLLAGTTSSKPFGAPVYPELTGLTIWPELETISARKKNPLILDSADAHELNFEIFPFWMDGNILEATRLRTGNPGTMKLFEKLVFFLAGKAGALSHTVPCYRVALERGVLYLIDEALRHEQAILAKSQLQGEDEQKVIFYRSVRTALEGITAYAANLSRTAADLALAEADPRRKSNLEALAMVCAQVPAGPARSFREAVNSLWILQVAIHAENINMAISPGRLDQILYPWYRSDMDSGALTVREALELVGCLWLKLNDNTNLVPETAEELFGGAGTVPAVTLGGVTEQGEDAVNDLTYVILKVTELLQTRDPSVNARYHPEKNSRDYLKRVADVVATTKCVPAFYNDAAAIRTLVNQGVSTEHARDYAIIGCVELSASGRSYDASSSILLNLVAALELALFNGKRPVTGTAQIGPRTGDPASFTAFDDFLAAFHTQLSWLISQAVQLNEEFGRTHQEKLPTPLLSALFEGPLESGKDLIFGGALYNASGATHIGFADVVDSLNAIEQLVFTDERFTLPQVVAAIHDDFEGSEPLRLWLANKAPKYGTDHPLSVKNSAALLAFLYETYQGYVNYRGGKYRPAFWTMTNHAGQGKLAGALPNGRKAHVSFASGITPVSQATPDLTRCMRSVARINPLHIPGGEAFNLKMVPVETPDDLERLTGAVAAYFDAGGLHVQFNLMTYQTLVDAKAHPDNYPHLLVRVSGYSAYFRDLNEAMKDEIITRTAYDSLTGIALSLPPGCFESHSDNDQADKKELPINIKNSLLVLPLTRFLDYITSEVVEEFLEVLLDLMKLTFYFDDDYRQNIEGFAGRYLFRSVDRSITVSAVFAEGQLHVDEEELPDPQVTVVFKDGKALMDFLLAENPDILGAMLRQEVTPEGNLNYLYKFAYLARHLKLMASGRA